MNSVRGMRREGYLLGTALLAVLILMSMLWGSAAAQGPDEQQLTEGQQLYAENCAVCHGPNGEGRVGATLAQNWPSIRPDLTVRTIIERGVAGSVMPAWHQDNGGPLTSEQIDALVAYILSWQTGGAGSLAPVPTFTPHPPIAPIPEVEGDPNRGAVLFADNCAVCHGPNGEGRVGATLPTNWPSIRPDLNVKAIISEGVQGSLMPAWHQDNGGPLTEEDVNDLVAFVLSRPAGTVQQVQPTAAPLSPVTIPWLQGWGGVIVFFVLITVLIAAALIWQRRFS